nr:conserved hypothetical protein [Bartonella sp. AR 15-3]
MNFDLKNNSMLSGDLLLKAAGGTINIKADSSQLKGDTIITGAATVNFDLKNNSKLSGNHLLKAAGGTIDIKADTSQLQGDTIITGAATVNFDLKNNSKLSGDFLLEVAGGTIDVKANNSQLQGDTIIIDTATVNFDLKNNSKLFGNLVLEADSGTININADNSQLKGSTLITGTATVNFDLKNNSKLSDDLLLEADSGIININADNSQLKGSTLITGPATVNFDLKNNSKLFGDLLLEQTGLSGDLLLEADSGTININADNSHLKGGTRITGTAKVNFDLKNNSTLFGNLVLEQTGLSDDLLLEADSGTININADSSRLKGGTRITGTAKVNFDLKNNSTLSGDSLLEADSGTIDINANNSQLKGGTLITGTAKVNFDLKNNSTWILTTRKNNNFINQRYLNTIAWSIASLKLDHSIVQFDTPKNVVYQILNVGKGSGVVYSATNDAQIHLNTSLNLDGSLDSHKTDRVLIHGNVSGTTTVYVTAQNGGSEGDIGENGNTQGVSLIQVSGTAQENSFKLNGDYITFGGSPYKYGLFAYGPSSSRGQANPEQKLVNDDGSNFWDYRLQLVLASPGSTPELGPRVPAVVPQLPSYLLLPHALFHAGVVDMSNQHELLEIIQNAPNEADDNRKTSFFIRGYGSNHRYTSNLSVLEHGYGADLDYNSMTAGVVLKTLENKQSALSFGMMGTYGRLSLQPLAVKQSQKSVFNKWSGKLYANLQHDAGFYVNGFFSYDFLKGDVVTLARGKTAALKGRLLSTSLMGGQAIITGYNGFIIEPQLQVIYQSIMFDKARDIDRFDIELGKHDQLIARVGGSLTKAVTSSEKARVISFYSKLHLAHSYENKRIVYFKDAFQLGAFGSTVETGMGVHAQLSDTIALHGDLLYKHKLTKAGFSGISVSSGLRYQF